MTSKHKQQNPHIACINLKQSISLTIITINMFLWPLISGVLFTNAQYSHGGSSALVVTAPCDFERLRRCQQDIVRDMQLMNQGTSGIGTRGSLESVDVQYSISSGPPYSPIQQAKQLAAQRQSTNLQTTCRLVRANLACIISATPACYDAGIQSAQNTDYILRAKRFLEINGCNGADQTWQGTICYRAPEAQTCEERYGLPTTTTYSTVTSSHRNLTSCLAYNAFRYCIETHLRVNCRAHEIDMINEYLIDHAGDLTWRCPLNGTAPNTATLGALQAGPNPYTHNDHLKHLAPSGYEQRPTYVGQSADITILSPVAQPWERFNDIGVSRRPGEIFGKYIVICPHLSDDIV